MWTSPSSLHSSYSAVELNRGIVTSPLTQSYSAVELIMRDSDLSLSHSSYSAVELIMRDSDLSITQQLLCSGAHYDG